MRMRPPHRPIGPVALFGELSFPMVFSAAGGGIAFARADVPEQKMLTDAIRIAFGCDLKAFGDLMEEIGHCQTTTSDRHVMGAVACLDAKTWIAAPALQHGVFGQARVVVTCKDRAEMIALAKAQEAQPTITLQPELSDLDLAATLLAEIEEKAARLLCNGFAMGGELASEMMHAGPYPASTDLRPISDRNFPAGLIAYEEFVH